MDLLQSIDPTKSGAFSDPFRPSFYELAAQEQLQDLLKPCLRYILSVLAQRNPRYLLRIINRFDEVYALFMWAIERHYLRTWGSSFAENFYGLRRRRRPGIATPRAKTASSARSTQQAVEALRPIDIHVSLLTLVGLPYAQARLHDLWEKYGGGVDAEQGGLFGDEDEGPSNPPRRAFVEEATWTEARIAKLRLLLKACFVKGYPYIGTAWQLWLLSYNVRYLFDKTPFWRPWLRLMRMDVRRVGPNDYVSGSGVNLREQFLIHSFPRSASVPTACPSQSAIAPRSPTCLFPWHAPIIAIHLLRSAQICTACLHLLLQVSGMVVFS
jgi:peroxin-12